jgi:hypothetical protein
LIWYFAGTLNGDRVYWNEHEPVGPQPAEHSPSSPEYPSVVRISKNISAVDQCTGLLFELLNFEADKEYQRVRYSAEDRKSREQFAEDVVRCEFNATRRTQLFLLRHPITAADANKDTIYNSIVSSQGTFSEYIDWMKGLDETKLNPLRYYGKAYDNLVRNKKE